MGQLEDAFADAAGEVAQIKAQPGNRYWWLYGTIKAKNSNGTLDVEIDGVTIQQMKATISCMMSDVGDRAIILKAGPIMTCLDVISRDRFTAVTTAVNSLRLFTTPTALTNEIKKNPEGKRVYFIIGHSSADAQKKGLIRAVGSIGDTRGENRCSFDIVLDFTKPVTVHVNHLATSSTAGISVRKASDGRLWLYAWTTSVLSFNSVSAAVLHQSAVDGYWKDSAPEGELIWSGDSAASSSISPGLFSGMSIGTGLEASGKTLAADKAGMTNMLFAGDRMSSDLDSATPGIWEYATDTKSNPNGGWGVCLVLWSEKNAAQTADWKFQLAFPTSGDPMWRRNVNRGGWSNWWTMHTD